jgi:CDGSH-type Zn-finger protein/uncharacterized Fe-S cluster protein YjdI
MNDAVKVPESREAVIFMLYEAAELEHNLMCTYLYAAFSLKSGIEEGLSSEEAQAVERWRSALIGIAIEEMGHLAAVWNITSALGGSPRIGRANFPVDPGYHPASVVVKLAPFDAATLQHFVHLERPHGANEPDGEGFAPQRAYKRGTPGAFLTPMAVDYETVGDFYATLAEALKQLCERYGEQQTFDGEPGLQLSPDEVNLAGARHVICIKTALAAFKAIVEQGEGAPRDSANSHYQRFLGVRTELRALLEKNPRFVPAHPAATNPVLRRPPLAEGHVWLDNPDAVAAVDLANASYALMLRLLAYSFVLRGPSREKTLAVDLAIGVMRAVRLLGERAARLPAGPSNPKCNAGMSFTTLRDAAPLPPGRAARRLFVERFTEIAAVAAALRDSRDSRAAEAAQQLAALRERAAREFEGIEKETAAVPAAAALVPAAPPAAAVTAAAAGSAEAASAPAGAGSDGVERVSGQKVDIEFEGRRCIHSRFCVTWAPQVFLANVKGPWIHPDAMAVEELVEVAHACPSGAIRYHRKDGGADEHAPPVNLASLREDGPYAFRAQLEISGAPAGFRATLCRCGASKHKPYCDGSHHEIGFRASGEPPSGKTDMLAVRDGVLAVAPQTDGPLKVSGNLEIMSGTGRVVARTTGAYLCRCGGSNTKPFCDGTHRKIGFKAP